MNEDSQVLYLGRWVSRKHFAAFVYNKNDKKLAKSYDEYMQLISSGLWQSTAYVEPEIEISDKPFKLSSDDICTQLISKESKIDMVSKGTKNDDANVVNIKPKRGRKCRNQLKE